jgi:hypothetical protein
VALSTVTLDSRSDLSQILESAFAECSSLSSIFIPPKLVEIGPVAFALTDLHYIVIGDGNCSFKTSGDFIVDLEGICLVLGFGLVGDVRIASCIEEIGDGCFAGSPFISSVIFECGSKLVRLGACAFAGATALSSICIPSSVEIIGEGCFDQCERLSTITFEPESKLSRIEPSAFQDCSSLSSICIPSSVEIISNSAFSQCTSLSTITFEPESKVSRIEPSAFRDCSSLSSICIPSSVEIISEACFYRCTSLSTITFETGSRLSPNLLNVSIVDLFRPCAASMRSLFSAD